MCAAGNSGRGARRKQGPEKRDLPKPDIATGMMKDHISYALANDKKKQVAERKQQVTHCTDLMVMQAESSCCLGCGQMLLCRRLTLSCKLDQEHLLVWWSLNDRWLLHVSGYADRAADSQYVTQIQASMLSQAANARLSRQWMMLARTCKLPSRLPRQHSPAPPPKAMCAAQLGSHSLQQCSTVAAHTFHKARFLRKAHIHGQPLRLTPSPSHVFMCTCDCADGGEAVKSGAVLSL